MSAFRPAAAFAWSTQNLSWAPVAELRAAASKSGAVTGVETTGVCVRSEEDGSAGVWATEMTRRGAPGQRRRDGGERDVPEVLDLLLDRRLDFFFDDIVADGRTGSAVGFPGPGEAFRLPGGGRRRSRVAQARSGTSRGGGGERRRGGDGSARSALAAMLSVEGKTAPMVVRGAGALGHVKGGIRRGNGRELEEEDEVGGCVSRWRLVL